MSHMILTRGLPGSGKSTWAKAWVTADPENRVRVNRDNIRRTVGITTGIGTPDEEYEVTHWQTEMISRALSKGKDVVVDNTNLRSAHVRTLFRLAAKHGADIEVQDFDAPLSVLIARDKVRAMQNKRFVGPKVITDMHKRFFQHGKFPPLPPFEEVEAEKFAPYNLAEARGEGLPPAIIVDIDGTLAHMTNRGPYDTSKYLDDAVDSVIRNLVDSQARKHNIIIVSGRSAEFRSVLIEWLGKHGIFWDRLFMRPAGDTRNDAIIKDELFEKHIAKNYAVDFVLDDRNRVVDMWRAKGLKCLQVQPGDF